MFRPKPNPVPATDVQFDVMLLQNRGFSSNYNRVVTISPDGRTIAYTSEALWFRALNEARPRAVPGTENARSIAFSDDSRQIAFWDGGYVKRVEIDGGVPIVVAELHERPFGMHWAADGFIYVGRADQGIWRVAAAGGEPERVLTLESGEHAHGPELLPGGEWILFTLGRSVRGWADGSIVVQSLVNNERRLLIQRGREARYTLNGYLTYVVDGGLFAASFDLQRLEVTGAPVAMRTDVHTSASDETGAAGYDISDDGVLVYAPPGGFGSRITRLAMLNTDGSEELLPMESRRFGSSRLSPDGKQIAAQCNDVEGTHIWIFAVDRVAAQRLTSTGRNTSPVWSHDGRYVYFASDRDGSTDIWRRAADLSTAAEQVLDAEGAQLPSSTSGDGRWLMYSLMTPGNSDVGRVSLVGDPVDELLVDSPADELDAKFSPDGRFFAFQSDETGRWDIHVVEFATGRRWIVSSTDGFFPFWTADGKRILYMSGSESFYGLDVQTAPEFKASEPAIAFRIASNRPGQVFDVTHDGRQVLVGTEGNANPLLEKRPRVTVVMNWLDQLEQRAGDGRR